MVYSRRSAAVDQDQGDRWHRAYEEVRLQLLAWRLSAACTVARIVAVADRAVLENTLAQWRAAVSDARAMRTEDVPARMAAVASDKVRVEVAELERHNAKLAAVGEGHARASAGERARADRWRRLCLAERVPVALLRMVL